MRTGTALLALVALTVIGSSGVFTKDPSLYEYYTSGGIKTGLEANSADHFTLNGKPFIIYSGSLHFFRAVPQYWRPLLQRFKAAGLNAVQFYLPWNLHEDRPGVFDFKSAALDLARFLEEIKLADMFAIVRPGPYICAEWEMGGYPSWLLRDPHLKLRSNYKPYLDRVKPFWDEALKIINKYQFSVSGGPVILLQTENEYSAGIHHPQSDEYLNFLLKVVRDSGFKELIFNSDPDNTAQRYPIRGVYKDNSVLQTANLNRNALQHLTELKKNQPGKPAFVSEFWPGWFDDWHEKHHHRYSVETFEHEISDLLFKVNGSVNFYMFFGGTNFAFLNGERKVTSYDYDAPLSEGGNYTAKYHKTRELYQKLVASGRFPKINLPDVPPAPLAHAYGKVKIEEVLPLEMLISHAFHFTGLKKPVPMELLNLGHDYGQRFGFILYRVEAHEPASDYKVTGPIKDHAILLHNGEPVHTVEDGANSLHLPLKHTSSAGAKLHHYDLLVENMGRVNGGDQMNHDHKGVLAGDIALGGKVQTNITVYSLDFNQTFVEGLKAVHGWAKFNRATVGPNAAPAFYRAKLTVNQQQLGHEAHPQDTYLQMTGWTKGNVFVNGFNIGRYWKVGPTKTLYVPGPLLKHGENVIEVFEQHHPGSELHFIDHPILE